MGETKNGPVLVRGLDGSFIRLDKPMDTTQYANYMHALRKQRPYHEAELARKAKNIKYNATRPRRTPPV